MSDTKYIKACYGYGRLTFKFQEKRGLFEKEWSLSKYKKELDAEGFKIDIKKPSKEDEKDRYCVNIKILNDDESITIDQIDTFSVDNARSVWDLLIEWGFKPTAKTQKILDRLA